MSNVLTKGVHWADEHPVIVGVAVFAIGGIVLLSLNKGGGASDGGMGAFYAAQAAQNASNNQVALAQVNNTGATAIAQIAANQNVAIANTGASVALAQNETAQQGQKQQFFLDTGVQQIEGAALPYILQRPDLASIFESFNNHGTGYTASH